MKKLLMITILSGAFITGCSHRATQTLDVYEVGCGSCIFDVAGAKGCPSYIKVDGKAIPLVGLKLSFHSLGLCANEAKAKVEGDVKDGKFQATSFKIVK